MSVPATLDPDNPLDNSIGAYYIGTVLSAFLYGICLIQGFLFFQKQRQDSWYIKASVIIVAISSVIQVIFAVMGVYFYVITNYHHPSELQRVFRPVMVEALLTGINCGIMQIFYNYRIWMLSRRNWLLSSSILLLICAEFGAGTSWATSALRLTTFRDLLKLTPLVITTNVLSCSVDILLATSLCILLHRARTGYKPTDTIINRLIIFLISSGLLTAIFAIAVFICVLASPDSLIYGAFYLCLGPLYTNSFLSTLNYRSTIAEEFHLISDDTIPQAQGTIRFRVEPTTQGVRHDEEALAGEVPDTKSDGHEIPLEVIVNLDQKLD